MPPKKAKGTLVRGGHAKGLRASTAPPLAAHANAKHAAQAQAAVVGQLAAGQFAKNHDALW